MRKFLTTTLPIVLLLSFLCGCSATSDNISVTNLKPCISCGESILEESAFCQYCGASTETATPNNVISIPSPSTPSQPTHSKSNDSEEAHEHNYILTDSKEATCISEGYQIYKCSICDNTYTNTFESAAHDFTTPTCTTARICKVCNITDGAPSGHTTERAICSMCGEVLFKEVYYKGSINLLANPKDTVSGTTGGDILIDFPAGKYEVEIYYEDDSGLEGNFVIVNTDATIPYRPMVFYFEFYIVPNQINRFTFEFKEPVKNAGPLIKYGFKSYWEVRITAIG